MGQMSVRRRCPLFGVSVIRGSTVLQMVVSTDQGITILSCKYAPFFFKLLLTNISSTTIIL